MRNHDFAADMLVTPKFAEILTGRIPRTRINDWRRHGRLTPVMGSGHNVMYLLGDILRLQAEYERRAADGDRRCTGVAS